MSKRNGRVNRASKKAKQFPSQRRFFHGRPDEKLFNDVVAFLQASGKRMSKHIVECVRVGHPLIVSGRAAVMKG